MKAVTTVSTLSASMDNGYLVVTYTSHSGEVTTIRLWQDNLIPGKSYKIKQTSNLAHTKPEGVFDYGQVLTGVFVGPIEERGVNVFYIPDKAAFAVFDSDLTDYIL